MEVTLGKYKGKYRPGWIKTKSGSILTKEQLEREILAGLTNREIAIKLGATVKSIDQALYHLKVSRGFKPLTERVTKKELNRLYWEEMRTQAEIAQQLRVSRTTIHNTMRKLGIPILPSVKAKQRRIAAGISHGPGWKEKARNNGGYIKVKYPGHPRADKRGNVLEHIIVWETAHNRKVPKGWIIHHLNGIRDDNRLENLVAMPRGRHSDLARPYKKRIRELEAKNKFLEEALKNNQMIFLS